MNARRRSIDDWRFLAKIVGAVWFALAPVVTMFGHWLITIADRITALEVATKNLDTRANWLDRYTGAGDTDEAKGLKPYPWEVKP